MRPRIFMRGCVCPSIRNAYAMRLLRSQEIKDSQHDNLILKSYHNSVRDRSLRLILYFKFIAKTLFAYYTVADEI